MKEIIQAFTERFRKEHHWARRYTAVMLVLALLTVLLVNWQLRSEGISMTADYQCGYEEHQHTQACYESVLICGYEEGQPETVEASADSTPTEVEYYTLEPEEPEPVLEPHLHTEECYAQRLVLDCYEEEHTHGDECFDEETGALICDKFEHTHDDSCYTVEYDLICGLEEGQLVEQPAQEEDLQEAQRPVVDLPQEEPTETVLHHHTEACYAQQLVCTIPEHHHTVECLADAQADVETAEEWQAAASVALNGNWAQDLVTVAQSQLDYKESEKNFKLDTEDQETLRGYSRYGAWYGNPYGHWDVMFVSYCLHFAGVPQTAVPQRAGVQALHSELRGSPWLTDGDGTTAQVGDLVIYNLTSTEQVVVNEDAGIALLDLDTGLDADTNMDPDLDADMAVETAQPEVEDRVVTGETVGIVVGLDPDTGDLTVISGDVEGQVAQLTLTPGEVTSVISVTGAYAAETTAGAPEDPDPAGSQEELDSGYALLEDEEGFGATVEWVGEARQLDPDAPALLAETTDTEAELKPSYVTKVEFEKKVGNSWVPVVGNEVESGTEVQVNVSYTLPAGTLTPNRPTLCYQLPEVMKPKQATSGKILDKTDHDKVIGTYTIDTNGLAKLTFDKSEKFTGLDAKGNLEFTGTFQFSRKVWADDFENNKTITFEKGYTLTIKKKTADIKISKGYTDYWSAFENHPESGTFINHYMVTVETTNGTKDPVTLTDTLNTNQSGISAGDYLKGGTYLKNSFKLYKEDASGKRTEILPFPDCKIQEDSNGNPQVVIKDLEALGIEEKYIWYYDVQRNYADFDKMPDGVGTIFNTATAQAGGKEEKAEAWYTCKTPRIEKKGEYDPKTGHIQWTITVKIPHSFLGTNLGSYMLQGCKITDSLPDGVKIVGDVKVGNTTISAEEFQKNGYTIPADYSGKELTITFETTTPLGGGSVTNKAQILTKSNQPFEASATVNIGQGDWTLNKQLASSSKGLAKWDISAANAAGESSFTLVETLQDAVNESGQTQLNTHYAYAAELEKALEEGLTLTLHDGSTMTYAQAKADRVVTVTYYSGANGTGGTVTANDPSTRVQSFTIQINKADGNPVRRVEVKDLPTHEDRSKVPTGEKWTYKNSVSIQGSSQRATAEDTYHSYKSFEKRVSANSDQDESGYQSGDQTYQYGKLSGKNLHYQLVVQTAADDDAAIVITDTLPENTEFKTDWVTIGMDEGTPDKVSNLKSATATVAYEETTRKLTITISGYNRSKNKQHKFRILYKVSVDDDPSWKNPSVDKVTYTNTAQWGELTETLHTTVEKPVDPLKKTGKLVGTDRIEYQVVVNPAQKDLSAAKDHAKTIELWDDVTAQNGAIVRGDLESVKLYYFQYDAATNTVTRGEEVDRRLYRVLQADEKGWLHMEIPNEAAMILVYQCDVKQGSAAEDYNVDNTVKLGNGDSTQSDSIQFTYASAATASTGQFLLHKVDDYSGVALQGAEFTIWQYDPQTGAWQRWSGGNYGVITTNEKGQVSLTVLENGDKTLKPDLLYKIVETKAPQNYQMDATPHYVLFHKSSEAPETAFATATNNGTAMDGEKTIQFADVQVGSAARTTTAQYTNRYSNLTVSKLWLDQNTNQPVDPAVDNIEIQVWRYTDNVESKEPFEKATLNETNHWTATWSGDKLPLTDKSGKAYHYLVEEVTTGNWNVYIDNNGVQTGNITIQNRVYTGYELPTTGGMGTAPFEVLGGVTAAAAAWLLFRRKKQAPAKEKE